RRRYRAYHYYLLQTLHESRRKRQSTDFPVHSDRGPALDNSSRCFRRFIVITEFLEMPKTKNISGWHSRIGHCTSALFQIPADCNGLCHVNAFGCQYYRSLQFPCFLKQREGGNCYLREEYRVL
ncbi:hypothetical protein PENTCL1PPCAC_24927, partial [Pristionchus entomophagus]